MRFYKAGKFLLLSVGLWLCLISCHKWKPNLETGHDKIEWGKRGEVPTLHEVYDWVCADVNTYIPRKK